jgi:hypothetical protein
MKPNPLLTHLPLVIGAALPIVFIVLILGLSYYSVSTVKPTYNFLYTVGGYPYYYGHAYKNLYEIVNGRVVVVPNPNFETATRNNTTAVEDAPKLYLYDIHRNAAREISYSEASAMNLTPGPGASPDGYSVEYRYSSEGIFGLFGSSGENNSGYFIRKGDSAKRLTGLSAGRLNYSNNLTVIGWSN